MRDDWSAETTARFLALHAEGLMYPEIGKRIGRSSVAVAGKARRMGLEKRSGGRKPHAERDDADEWLSAEERAKQCRSALDALIAHYPKHYRGSSNGVC